MSAAGTGDVSVAGICQIRDLGVWDAARAYRAAFTAAGAAELTGSGSAGYYLRQAALEAVIEAQMRVRCAISIHRALLAGAPAAEIAHVLGTTTGDVAGRWQHWAAGQRRLQDRWPGLGVSQPEYDRAAAALEDADGTSHCARCSCTGTDAQIGSPHP